MLTATDMPEQKKHHGRNLKRFREILGVKQEALALELGDDWNQKKISRLEEREIIEDELMEQIAAALKVPAESIKNFDEEKAIYNIQHNYEGATQNNNIATAYNCTFNPIDKIVELYDALLKEKDEKNELLERLLKEKGK